MKFKLWLLSTCLNLGILLVLLSRISSSKLLLESSLEDVFLESCIAFPIPNISLNLKSDSDDFLSHYGNIYFSNSDSYLAIIFFTFVAKGWIFSVDMLSWIDGNKVWLSVLSWSLILWFCWYYLYYCLSSLEISKDFNFEFT